MMVCTANPSSSTGSTCGHSSPSLLPTSWSCCTLYHHQKKNTSRPQDVEGPGRQELKNAERSGNRCFRKVCLSDGDLMISFDQVCFRKNIAASRAVIEGLHVGQGVPVRYCDGIEAVVVTAGVPGAAVLGNQGRLDAQAELEWRIVPAFSSVRNSSSETRCYLGSSRLVQAAMGAALPVSIRCAMPCSGLGVAVSNCFTWSGRAGTAVSGLQGLLKEVVLALCPNL
jgi:hypothetical protein